MTEYKKTLDLYYLWDLNDCDADGNLTETNFSINIENENEGYELQITNKNVLKVITTYDKKLKTYNKNLSEIACFVDEETLKENNQWTWDDAIKVIKKRLDKECREHVSSLPTNKMVFVTGEHSSEFIDQFNSNKVSEELLDSCRKAGELFGCKKQENTLDK